MLKGVHKKKINKGIVIKGGGEYGYNRFTYYFNEEGIMDKLVFDTVMSGTLIKYADIL